MCGNLREAPLPLARTTVFTFDATGCVGKKIVATSLETTGVPAGAAGRRLSLAAIQAAVTPSAAPTTPLVEKTVMVPLYPAPQPATAAASAAAGVNAGPSEVAVTSPMSEGQNATAATQRRISFVVQEDVAAAAQVREVPIHYMFNRQIKVRHGSTFC